MVFTVAPGHRGLYEARSLAAAPRPEASHHRPGVAAGEDLEGGVDAGAVAGGEQVEQQAAGDRQPQAGVGPGDVGGHAQRGRQRHVGVEPVLHVVLQQRPDGLVALQRPPVEREEQALEVGQRGVGQVGPHPADQLVGLGRRRPSSPRRQTGLGPRLHRADDLEQQAVLGAEVVQEHAVAGPDRLGDAAQALVGQPLGREVLDHGVEQALPGVPSHLFPRPGVPARAIGRPLVHHVPNGTFRRRPRGGQPWPSR